MFLGTPRLWWIAAALPLILAFVLLLTGDGTALRTGIGVLLLLLAMVLFGMAPMRYGRGGRTPPPQNSSTTSPPAPIAPVAQSRPPIEGRDASEV
jgi:hypothetical protein